MSFTDNQNVDTSCLYSTVKNTSGRRAKFGFLPPHGKELAANEEYTVYGSIYEAVIRHERTEGRKNVIAFERALQRGDIIIINTPNPIMEDMANPGSTQMLRLLNGALGVVDPCWLTSSSQSAPIG